MTYERKDCPACHHSDRPMRFIWPSRQSDPAIEAVIGRFQQCPDCGWQGDIQTEQKYDIARVGTELRIDGKLYPTVGAWLRAIGMVEGA